jgi:hypothetical protein
MICISALFVYLALHVIVLANHSFSSSLCRVYIQMFVIFACAVLLFVRNFNMRLIVCVAAIAVMLMLLEPVAAYKTKTGAQLEVARAALGNATTAGNATAAGNSTHGNTTHFANHTERAVPLTNAEFQAVSARQVQAAAAATTTTTDAPKTDAPKTDAPKTDAPKTDAPKTDAPKTDAPKTDAPKTDAPKTDAPKTGAPKPGAPKPDAPKPETTKQTTAAPPSGALPNTAQDHKGAAVTPKLLGAKKSRYHSLPSHRWTAYSPGEGTEQKHARRNWNEAQVNDQMDEVTEQFDDVVGSLTSFHRPVVFPPSFVSALRKAGSTAAAKQALSVYTAAVQSFYRDVENSNHNVKLDSTNLQAHVQSWYADVKRTQGDLNTRVQRFGAAWTDIQGQLNGMYQWANNSIPAITGVQKHLRLLIASLSKCPDRVVRGLDVKAVRSLATYSEIEEILSELAKVTPAFVAGNNDAAGWNATLREIHQMTADISVTIQKIGGFATDSLTSVAAHSTALIQAKATEQATIVAWLKKLNSGAVGAGSNSQYSELAPLPVPEPDSADASNDAFVEIESTPEAKEGNNAPVAAPAAAAVTRNLVSDKLMKPLSAKVDTLISTLKKNLLALGGAKVPNSTPWKDQTDQKLHDIELVANKLSDNAVTFRTDLKKAQIRGRAGLQKLSASLDAYLSSPVFKKVLTLFARLHDLVDINTGRLARIGQVAALRIGEMQTGMICTNEVSNIQTHSDAIMSQRNELHNLLAQIVSAETKLSTAYVQEFAYEQAVYVDEDDENNMIEFLREIRHGVSRVHRDLNRLTASSEGLRRVRAAFFTQIMG